LPRIGTVRPARSSQRRVSWTIRSPSRAPRLALDLVLDRLRDEADRVDVLDLDARPERRVSEARTETFASQRRFPFSMSPSLMSMYRTRRRSSVR
jgi:hypothetical protein